MSSACCTSPPAALKAELEVWETQTRDAETNSRTTVSGPRMRTQNNHGDKNRSVAVAGKPRCASPPGGDKEHDRAHAPLNGGHLEKRAFKNMNTFY